ncbi:MAG: PilZ domain-containing protein [Hyphomicrobiales bacterium]
MTAQHPTPRASLRLRRLKEGRVIFNGRKSVLSCLVRDVSETGVRIKIGEPFRVPDIFQLEVSGQPPRDARKGLDWR